MASAGSTAEPRVLSSPLVLHISISQRLLLEGLTAGFQGWRPAILCRPRHLGIWQRYSPATLATLRTQNGYSMPKRLAPGLEQLLAYHCAIRPPRVAITKQSLARSRRHPCPASAGRGVISEVARRKKDKAVRRCSCESSCAASSSTSCRMAFIAFVTMDCWQTAIAPKATSCADACSLRPLRRRLARRKARPRFGRPWAIATTMPLLRRSSPNSQIPLRWLALPTLSPQA